MHINAVLQPEFFVEMSEELAAEKGIQPGQMVRVWSNRGEVKGRAFVTKRFIPLQIDGKTVHSIGMPLNFGFIGLTKKASPINCADAAGGGRQRADAGVQGVPRRCRAHRRAGGIGR